MLKLILSFFIFTFLCSIGLNTFSQSKKEQEKEHERMLDTLEHKISGVKYADFRFSTAQENIIINNSNSGDAIILNAIVNYLKTDLGLSVIVTKEQRDESIKLAKTQCDYVQVNYELGQFKSTFMAVGSYPFKFSFVFCDKSQYSFETRLNVNGLTNYNQLIRNTCKYNFPIKRKYSEENKLKIPSNSFIISLNDFTKYLDSEVKKKPIEGLFQMFNSNVSTSKYKLGIYSQNDSLKIVYFDGADFSEDWREGESKGYLFSTLSENDFILKYFALDKKFLDGSLTLLNNNSFEIRFTTIGKTTDLDKYVRIK